MRYAYLIKHSGDQAELVAHGPVTEVKPRFIAAEIKKGDELVLIGPDIRTKRRGKSGDIDAYLALVEKENIAMRDRSRREAEAPKGKIPKPSKSETEATAEREKKHQADLASKEAAKAEANKQLNKTKPKS